MKKDKTIIKYKQIKHAYVRVTKDNAISLSIPWWCFFDLSLKQKLINKGKILLRKKLKSGSQDRGKRKQEGGKGKTRENQYQKQRIGEDRVMIWGEKITKSDLPKNIDKYLRKLCYEQAKVRCDEYSEKLGIPYNKLTIKKVVSRRGSCSSLQNININFALVHLDKKFLRYVVIHEVCHLQEKHHQKSFWDLVETYCPEYKTIMKELREVRLR